MSSVSMSSFDSVPSIGMSGFNSVYIAVVSSIVASSSRVFVLLSPTGSGSINACSLSMSSGRVHSMFLLMDKPAGSTIFVVSSELRKLAVQLSKAGKLASSRILVSSSSSSS